jgi:exoribonuclease-2
LEGNTDPPAAVKAVPGLDDNLRLQDRAAQSLKAYRHLHGALSLESQEARPVFDGDQVTGLELHHKNRATELIEDFMIAANGVTARFLEANHYPSIRRVVRTPRRWDRIVQLASEHGAQLPAEPDSHSLERFLTRQKAADPLRFPDLSLAIIKLLGPGEYVAEAPGEDAPGHFGLAVKDYAHSTAPNRRFTDLITQRLLKSAIEGRPLPYNQDELQIMAAHCTEEEDNANKVERQVNKSAAALLLETRIGEQFDALVTGAAPKGTWVRLLNLPVEGKLVHGVEGLDIGDRIRVQLVFVDVDLGYIDFARVFPRKR